MSSVNNITGNTPVQKLSTPTPVLKQAPAAATSHIRASDRVELSGVSHLLETLKKNDVRTEKVADIRSQIQAGTYEDDKKLDIATSKLLDELLK